MSCGPAESVQQLVDGINNVVDQAELAISALPKKIATIPGYAEVQLAVQVYQDLQLLKELLDDPLALIEHLIPSLPLEFQQYIEAGNRLVGETLEKVEFVEGLAEKYGNVDYGDPEELLGAINDLGGDLTKLCEIIPNIQTRYGEFVEKGKQVSGTLKRPKNPVKQVKFAIQKRYEDVYSGALDKAKSAKDAVAEDDSVGGFSELIFGKNKKEVKVSNEEKERYREARAKDEKVWYEKQDAAFAELEESEVEYKAAKEAFDKQQAKNFGKSLSGASLEESGKITDRYLAATKRTQAAALAAIPYSKTQRGTGFPGRSTLEKRKYQEW